MKITKMKKLLSLTTLLFTCFLAFAQKGQDTLKVNLGNTETDKVFMQKVTVSDSRNDRKVLLNDGNYAFKNNEQTIDISIKKGLIYGLVFVTNNHNKEKVTQYKIENSMVKEFTIYIDSLLCQKGHRDDEKAYYKEYYPDEKQTLKSEGWMSLDKNKYYGRGISKKYYENGTLSYISDRVTETYTEFYPNGNKKKKQGQNIYETYNEDGNLHNKQYTKNNIRYNDYYNKGKLNTRSYQDEEKNEVREYYQNGVFQKRAVEKKLNGEIRTLSYDKAGKLINNEPPYSGVSEVQENKNK